MFEGDSKRANLDLEFRSIATASIYSEVVYTEPSITIIWDTYQWEMIEKFLISAYMYKNGKEDLAMSWYKMNIFAALSVKLTTISPELAYLFAEHYVELIQNSDYSFAAIVSDTFQMDYLYCELLTLGHELSHILFDKYKNGSLLYHQIENDFAAITHGILKSKTQIFSLKDVTNNIYKDIQEETIKGILEDRNFEYRKEIICDIMAHFLIDGYLISFEEKTIRRNTQVLLDDVMALYSVIIRLLDGFSYLFDIFARISNIGREKHEFKPNDMQSVIPQSRVSEMQIYARETLGSVFIRTCALRDFDLFIENNNTRYYELFACTSKLAASILSFKDREISSILKKYHDLLKLRIAPTELINKRNELLCF